MNLIITRSISINKISFNICRNAALQEERERAAVVASRPTPDPNPVDALETPKGKDSSLHFSVSFTPHYIQSLEKRKKEKKTASFAVQKSAILTTYLYFKHYD